ncbi:uncharacterized, partial [Tachysurus ichikawai]
KTCDSVTQSRISCSVYSRCETTGNNVNFSDFQTSSLHCFSAKQDKSAFPEKCERKLHNTAVSGEKKRPGILALSTNLLFLSLYSCSVWLSRFKQQAEVTSTHTYSFLLTLMLNAPHLRVV